MFISFTCITVALSFNLLLNFFPRAKLVEKLKKEKDHSDDSVTLHMIIIE